MINVRYFFEKTNQDYEEHDKLWDENRERFVFLFTNISPKQQMDNIMSQLDNNKEFNIAMLSKSYKISININKDILAVRFPTVNFIKKNKIINSILLGNGVNKVWYPKEIWVYSLM